MRHTLLDEIFGPTFSDYYAGEPRSKFDLVPDSSLERDYSLIQQKKSQLSANERRAVVYEYEKRAKQEG